MVIAGEVDPNGCRVLECGPPAGDAAALMDYELEKLARHGPCAICGAEGMLRCKWRSQLGDAQSARNTAFAVERRDALFRV